MVSELLPQLMRRLFKMLNLAIQLKCAIMQSRLGNLRSVTDTLISLVLVNNNMIETSLYFHDCLFKQIR